MVLKKLVVLLNSQNVNIFFLKNVKKLTNVGFFCSYKRKIKYEKELYLFIFVFIIFLFF